MEASRVPVWRNPQFSRTYGNGMVIAFPHGTPGNGFLVFSEPSRPLRQRNDRKSCTESTERDEVQEGEALRREAPQALPVEGR